MEGEENIIGEDTRNSSAEWSWADILQLQPAELHQRTGDHCDHSDQVPGPVTVPSSPDYRR